MELRAWPSPRRMKILGARPLPAEHRHQTERARPPVSCRPPLLLRCRHRCRSPTIRHSPVSKHLSVPRETQSAMFRSPLRSNETPRAAVPHQPAPNCSSAAPAAVVWPSRRAAAGTLALAGHRGLWWPASHWPLVLSAAGPCRRSTTCSIARTILRARRRLIYVIYVRALSLLNAHALRLAGLGRHGRCRL